MYVTVMMSHAHIYRNGSSCLCHGAISKRCASAGISWSVEASPPVQHQWQSILSNQQTTNIYKHQKLSWRIMNYHEESWTIMKESWTIMKNHDYHELFLWSEESLTTVDGPAKSKKSPILDGWNPIKNGMFWTHRTQRWCFPGKHVF